MTIIISKYITGNWFQWLQSPYFIGAAIFLFIFLIISLINRRIQGIKDRINTYTPSYQSPTYGWSDIKTISYCDVNWMIREPIYDTGPRVIAIDYIEAKMPARCPHCETDLEEKETFFKHYMWSCISCGYKKTNKLSMDTESQRAVRKAKREID